MNEITRTIVKSIKLTESQASRLDSMAKATQSSEADIVAKALDLYFSLSAAQTPPAKSEDWTQLSEEALERVWDNKADAQYDYWRELYGVPAR